MDTGGFAVPLDTGEWFWRTWLRDFGHRPRLRSRAVHQFWYLSDARSPSRELRPRICVSPWCGDASRKCVPRNRNVNRASLCQVLASLSVTPNIYAGPELWTCRIGVRRRGPHPYSHGAGRFSARSTGKAIHDARGLCPPGEFRRRRTRPRCRGAAHRRGRECLLSKSMLRWAAVPDCDSCQYGFGAGGLGHPSSLGRSTH